VAIPEILALYNLAVAYRNTEASRAAYAWVQESARPHNCVACGECEKKCPQKIAIIDWLKKAGAILR